MLEPRRSSFSSHEAALTRLRSSSEFSSPETALTLFSVTLFLLLSRALALLLMQLLWLFFSAELLLVCSPFSAPLSSLFSLKRSSKFFCFTPTLHVRKTKKTQLDGAMKKKQNNSSELKWPQNTKRTRWKRFQEDFLVAKFNCLSREVFQLQKQEKKKKTKQKKIFLSLTKFTSKISLFSFASNFVID